MKYTSVAKHVMEDTISAALCDLLLDLVDSGVVSIAGVEGVEKSSSCIGRRLQVVGGLCVEVVGGVEGVDSPRSCNEVELHGVGCLGAGDNAGAFMGS